MSREIMMRKFAVFFIFLSIVADVRAQEPSESQELIFPLVATGHVNAAAVDAGRWETTFVVLNLSNTTHNGRLEIFQNDGTRVTDLSFSETLLVPGNGLALSDIYFQTIIAAPRFLKIDGWGRVILPRTARVHAQTSVRFMKELAGTVITRTHVDAVTPSMDFRTFLINRNFPPGHSEQSAYAFVNPSLSETANIEVTADLALGPQFRICQSKIQVPPRHRVAKFTRELFPSCAGLDLLGFPRPDTAVMIKSDIPIAVAALDVILPDVRISSLPVKTP